MRLNKPWRNTAWLLALALILSGFAVSASHAVTLYDGRPQTGLAEEPLVIVTETGERHDFTVEMAITPREQAVGMMYRRNIPRDHGMLFPFAEPKIATFWMKNTLASLDLLFIDTNGIITDIHRRAVPHSLDPIPSSVPVIAVLELAGGEADRRDIRAGDQVEHRLFQAQE